MVEVRSEEEILRTLDADGKLDGLPFMPEMLGFCGRRYRVRARAHKACDTIDWQQFRRMDSAVHLENLRCDGSAHGGCQAGCLIYWKEAWLRPVEPGGRRGGRVGHAGAGRRCGGRFHGGAFRHNADRDERGRGGALLLSGDRARQSVERTPPLVGAEPVRGGHHVGQLDDRASCPCPSRRAAQPIPAGECTLPPALLPHPRLQALPVHRRTGDKRRHTHRSTWPAAWRDRRDQEQRRDLRDARRG